MDKPNILAGAVGGLVGGVLLALVIQIAGLIHTAGRVVGLEGAAAGWATLVVVGLLLGVLYALVLGRLKHSWGTGLAYGAVYGVVWWVLGTLIILPLAVGQAVFTVGAATAANFVGYMLLGIGLGLVYTAMAKDSTTPPGSSASSQASDPAAQDVSRSG